VAAPEPLGRDAYRAWSSITLRWGDNDVYGHVNNAVHYRWFDDAVNRWLIEAGLLDIIAGDPIGLVVATACDYFAPLAFPGEVEVGIAVERLGRSSVTYRIGIFVPGTAEPAAQGCFTHVYVDRAGRKPVALPTEWRARLETLS
jgi:acyl-CoA thioester hydrolase